MLEINVPQLVFLFQLLTEQLPFTGEVVSVMLA
jgi:hypothetical protein